MKLTRRDLLASIAAVTLPKLSWAEAPALVLEPRPASIQLLPEEYPVTEIWGYNGLVPGPEIRVRQGQMVQQQLRNGLTQPTAIHWHGVRIDNAMDGVPGLTQEAVPPDQSFDYRFVAPDAGTYWYHSHNQSTEQVARGLYGALIVEEADSPDVDREEVLVLSDWQMQQSGEMTTDFMSPHARSHAGRMGNFITTSGVFQPEMTVRRNERLRLRLINAATARIFSLGLVGLEGWVVALDGMPLETPQKLEGEFLLAPAQRIDLIVDVIEETGRDAFLVRFDEDQGSAQVVFNVRGQVSASLRTAPQALPRNPEPRMGPLADATRARLKMEGGAMGRMDAAMLDGERMSFRQIAQTGQFWAFNGAVGLTDAPLIDASKGETVRLDLENQTVFPHAMHLHGQHFREVLKDGTFGPMRDTILVFGQEKREIIFVADNPGKWLFHCHMLSHQDAGMKTWMRVSA